MLSTHLPMLGEASQPPPPPPPPSPSPPRPSIQPCRTDTPRKLTTELMKQRGIAIPLIVMNLAWLAKQPITTMFLGRLGTVQLAGGVLGYTFANVTGYSVLAGLAGAMEPICGQAYGSKNIKLLHKTLIMTTLLLLLVTFPISILWLNIDKILVHFGLQNEMTSMARTYVLYLLPDLLIMSFLCPLKAYLTAQGVTVPILFSSTIAVAFHVPANIFLSKSTGVAGVAIAVWLSDLVMTLGLLVSVLALEIRLGKWKEGGWFDHRVEDRVTLLRLCGPCCLTTCLEWWCYEILVLLAGRLVNATEAVSVLVIVLNFDYLLYSVTVSLSVCGSTRVSNELGANRAKAASWSVTVSLGTAAVSGCLGAVAMAVAGSWWGPMFTHDKKVIQGVEKMMTLMALFELANFPVTVCGGIPRGMARPWLGTCANLGGLYLVALPLGIVLGFKAKLRLKGLLSSFIVGVVACLVLLSVFLARTDWAKEAAKAQVLTSDGQCVAREHEDITSERVIELDL